MPIPRVAIVGRPNVGKSSLLNMIAREKVSIVDPTAGTTRDRVSVSVDLPPPNRPGDDPGAITMEVTDTGGFGVYVEEGRRFDDVGRDLSALTDDIEFQISQAVGGADLVLFVIDAQAGVTAADERIARLLRERLLGSRRKKGGAKEADARGDEKRDIRIRVVANKCDGPRWEAHALEAAGLGFGEPISVSAKNNYFRRDFLDALYQEVADIPWVKPGRAKDHAEVKIAIIGKRNSGKSSLVNAIAGESRVIVSEIAGTTRDAIDVRVSMDGREFVVIDTAGLRRKKSFADRIEWWAFDRAQRSIERADVVLLLVDATEALSQVDQQLMKLVQSSYKPCVVVVNKWDLAEGRTASTGAGAGKWKKGQAVSTEMYEQYLVKETKGLDFAPLAFISATTGQGVREAIETAFDLVEQAGMRAPTGKLNRVLKHILSTRGPSSKLGTFAKTYFISQVAVHPPTIVLVVNKPQLFTPNYQRFLLNRLRENLDYAEVPIKLIIKERKRARIEDLLSGEHQRLKAEGAAVVSDDALIEAVEDAFEEDGSDSGSGPPQPELVQRKGRRNRAPRDDFEELSPGVPDADDADGSEDAESYFEESTTAPVVAAGPKARGAKAHGGKPGAQGPKRSAPRRSARKRR